MKRTMLLLAVLLSLVVAACSPAAEGDAVSQLITPDGYNQQFLGAGQDHLLIDVRTPQEFFSGHIAGAININVDEIAQRLHEIPRDVPIVVYCRSGNRSATAARILADAGYTPVYDLGGIQNWVGSGYPIQ